MKSTKIMQHIPLRGFIIFLSLLFCHFVAPANPPGVVVAPDKMNYQAVARNSTGIVLPNQAISVQFTIHDAGASGTIIYQETQALTTNQFGLFTAAVGTGLVTIGTWAAIDWTLNDKYLQVGLDPSGGSTYINMGTSQLLSVPYAFAANKAVSSMDNHWTATGNDIYNVNTGYVGVGTNAPSHTLHVESNTTPGSTGIIHSENKLASNDAYAVVGLSAMTDYYGTGGFFSGGWRGIVGSVSPSGAEYYFGVTGNVSGGTGHNYGLYGFSDQVGMLGNSSGTGTGITHYYGGGYPEVAGAVGYSEFQQAAFGFSYGVVGEAWGDSARYNAGIFGYAANSHGLNSRNWGVYGLTDDSSSGVGVLGIAQGTGNNMHGIEGDVITGTSQIGVFGYVSGATASDYAGSFQGQIYATAASAGIKAFKIDHPLDPANKYLFHSSVESSDMMNIYSGNVTTDANGLAVIQFPSYFEVLNKDFRYQLTCISQFAQAIIQEKIHNNSFTIKTNLPNVEVSWQVSGVRHDPVADMYRIVPEVDKPASEKGKYLVPEAYGKSRAEGLFQPSYVEQGTPVRKVVRPSDDPKLKK